jgi:hypothetical protein
VFSGREFDDARVGMKSYEVTHMLRKHARQQLHLNRNIVAVGNMDENWGWLSSCFTNRTISWGFNFNNSLPNWVPVDRQQEEVSEILDHPNITAIFINQHNNVSNGLLNYTSSSITRPVFPS